MKKLWPEKDHFDCDPYEKPAWNEAIDQCRKAVEEALDVEEIYNILRKEFYPTYVSERLKRAAPSIRSHLMERLFGEEQ